MKKKYFYITFLFLILLFNNNIIALPQIKTTNSLLRQADNDFENKNYIEALNNYNEVLIKEKNTLLKKKIKLKILQTLKSLNKWDELIKEFENEIKNEKNNIYLADLYNLGAYIYLDIDHEGYKKDNKIYRDKSYREGEYVYLYNEDIKKSYEYFLKAKDFYSKEKESKEINEKIININFELVNNLKNNIYPIFDIKLADPKIADKEKIIFLLDEIIDLNKLVKKDSYSAKALFEKGVHIFKTNRYENDKKYSESIKIFWETIEKYPKEKFAEESLYSICEIYLISNQTEKAIEIFNKLIRDYPKSIRVSDCKANLQEIYKKELSISSMGVQLPGKPLKLNINYKNIDNINLEIFEIDFENIIKRNSEISNYNYFKNKISEVKKYYKKSVIKKNIELSDKKDLTRKNKNLDLDILPEGTYIVEVTDNKNNTSIALLLISNITIVKNTDTNKALIRVLDRESGKAVSNANITVKENYYDNQKNNFVTKAKTDKNGLFIYTKQKNVNYYSNIDVIAVKNKSLTFADAHYYDYYTNREKGYKSYIYTDRPIYRPNHKVNFKNIIRISENGELKNIPNQKIRILVNNPKGEKVYEKEMITNDFGTVNDSFLLNNNAPLGIYNIYTYIDNYNQIGSYQNTFRVEEYKKPEFLVKVESKDNDIYPGDIISANVNVSYYFVSPVINSKVHYKIVRNKFYYQHDFFPFYRKIYPYPNYDNDSSVWKEGDLTTDDKGNAYIQFETEKTNIDYNYQILVDVTDSSRRNIKGAKSIKVTQKGFNAFIDFEKGFYSAGENVNIEISLKNPQDEPIINKGKLTIKKIIEKKEEEIISKELKTDSTGKVSYKWKTEKEGTFKIIFETYDKRKNLVVSERSLFITGEEFDSRNYKFQNLEIITDKDNYNIGDTAKIMINSDLENSYIMFFIETGSEIISNKLINIKNKSSFLDFKIEKKHIPNFNIKVAMIRNNQLFIQNKEISVPPSEQFINIEIQTEKDKYLPGEKGKIKVKTTDYRGKPISSEVSLSVIDKSLLYLQEDSSINIKDYFYGEKRSFNNSLYSSLYPYLFSATEDNFIYINYIRNESYLDYYSSGRYKSSKVQDMNEAMPAPSSAIKASEKSSMKIKDEKKSDRMIIPEPEIRSYFADTALWEPVLNTNSKGIAETDIKFPDSITTWLIKSNATDIKSKIGDNQKEIITKKNIMVRLQAPRFFVERDEITLSAIVNNDFDFYQNISCEINLPKELELISNKLIKAKVESKGEKRFDWKVKVKKEGNVSIMVKALGNNESDAVKLNFPVHIHGINKSVFSGSSMKNEKQKDIDLFIPKERKIGSEKLLINFSPSVLSVMIESLPYLVNYPYGCIEQTTSKFIPLVMASKTIKNLGINLEDIKKRNNNIKNPIYDNNEIQKIVNIGFERIYGFQNSDGGWGWWNGFRSDTYMTSYVIYSLLLARENNFYTDSSVIERGFNFLKTEFNENNNIYNRIYVAYVLSMSKKINESSLEPFFKSRDNLNNYGKALLSLAYSNLGNKEKSSLICKNLKSFVREDKENASWDNNERMYWRWYGDNIETNTFILKAFLKSSPSDPIIPKIVNWLITKRKDGVWNSTKDTANIIYTLTDFAKINNEMNPNYTISVIYNNKVIKKIKVNKENMFNFDNKIEINDLKENKSKITIKKEGQGILYYSSVLEYFTLEEGIKSSGKGININREYYKITENKDKTEKEKLNKDDILKSGDIVEVKLIIKADNDYDYLIFEDMKPSGFEAVDLKSGYVYQNTIYYNREFRDEKVVFFIDQFKQGTQVITYRLRAEIPGKFHILPHNTYAMYSPEIKSISDEMNLGVID